MYIITTGSDNTYPKVQRTSFGLTFPPAKLYQSTIPLAFVILYSMHLFQTLLGSADLTQNQV